MHSHSKSSGFHPDIEDSESRGRFSHKGAILIEESISPAPPESEKRPHYQRMLFANEEEKKERHPSSANIIHPQPCKKKSSSIFDSSIHTGKQLPVQFNLERMLSQDSSCNQVTDQLAKNRSEPLENKLHTEYQNNFSQIRAMASTAPPHLRNPD